VHHPCRVPAVINRLHIPSCARKRPPQPPYPLGTGQDARRIDAPRGCHIGLHHFPVFYRLKLPWHRVTPSPRHPVTPSPPQPPAPSPRHPVTPSPRHPVTTGTICANSTRCGSRSSTTLRPAILIASASTCKTVTQSWMPCGATVMVI